MAITNKNSYQVRTRCQVLCLAFSVLVTTVYTGKPKWVQRHTHKVGKRKIMLPCITAANCNERREDRKTGKSLQTSATDRSSTPGPWPWLWRPFWQWCFPRSVFCPSLSWHYPHLVLPLTNIFHQVQPLFKSWMQFKEHCYYKQKVSVSSLSGRCLLRHSPKLSIF